MIVAALLYPPHEVTEPLQLDASGSMELPFHIGHILEEVIFLNAPPLVLALEKMLKNLVYQLIPFCLLEGGKIVLIIGPEDTFEVLPPPLAPIIGDISRGSLGALVPLPCWHGVLPGVEAGGTL